MQGAPRFEDPFTALWATGVFMSCLVILATINIASPRKWKMLRQAALRMRLGNQALRGEVEAGDRDTLGLQAVAISSMAMLLWQAGSLSGAAAKASYLYFFIGTAAVIITQAFLLRTIALFARSDAGIGEFLHTGRLLHAVVGISVLPLTMLAAYHAPWREAMVWIGILFLGAGVLYRWFRGAWIGLSAGVPARFIVLYLCAAEIGPLLLALSLLRKSPTLHS